MPRKHTGKRAVPLIYGVGKTGYSHAKELNLILSATVLKTSTQNCKIIRGGNNEKDP